jgi:hypothetical protein
MSNEHTFWERFHDVEIGLLAAKKAGMSVTGTNPKIGLRLVGTNAQEAIYRREYERLLQEREAQVTGAVG